MSGEHGWRARIGLLALPSLVIDEITLVRSRCGPFQTALQALRRGLARVLPYLCILSFRRGSETFEKTLEKKTIKVLIKC